VAQAFETSLLLNSPQPDALRFMPALNVTREEIAQMIGGLDAILTKTGAARRVAGRDGVWSNDGPIQAACPRPVTISRARSVDRCRANVANLRSIFGCFQLLCIWTSIILLRMAG